MTRRYDPKKLKDGWNTLPDGEKIFYISNPALGLWACRGALLRGPRKLRSVFRALRLGA